MLKGLWIKSGFSECFQSLLLYNQLGKAKEMEKKALTPISLVKSKEMREKYECGICTEVCVKPMRCRGSCKKIYCMKCVSDWRQAHDICPFKCSSPFLVEKIPDVTLEFFCPYEPTECSLHIGSLKEFDSHYKICPFVPPEEI